jgi:hypothetical protein
VYIAYRSFKSDGKGGYGRLIVRQTFEVFLRGKSPGIVSPFVANANALRICRFRKYGCEKIKEAQQQNQADAGLP